MERPEGDTTNKSVRDISMDNVKGLLMASVVFVHMYDMTCAKTGWMHVLRLAILTVQMPLFMFISGYFGKNTEKRRDEALREYLIPFLVLNTLYYFVRHWQGKTFSYGVLRPFNMYWYLLVLILYRLLMGNLKRVRGLFPLSIVCALLAGFDTHLGRTLSLSRAICFFPFYLMGYYCPKEGLERARHIPRPLALLSLAACTAVSWTLSFVMQPSVKASHPYQLVGTYAIQKLTWYDGMLMRLSIYILAPIMGAALIALCMRKQCVFTKIGRNSLAVYLLHAFPMLLALEFLPEKLPATGGTFVFLVLYALVVSRLLACDGVTRAYHAVFDPIKHALFPGEEQPFFPLTGVRRKQPQCGQQRKNG